jgi:hypothetical protein
MGAFEEEKKIRMGSPGQVKVQIKPYNYPGYS